MIRNPFAEPLTRRRHYITAVRTWTPGELVTAGMMNSIRDLFVEIESGTAEMLKTTFIGRTSAALAADLSAAGKAKLAYNSDTGTLQSSVNGGAYTNI